MIDENPEREVRLTFNTSAESRDRFKAALIRSRRRQELKKLSHGEFLKQLLDVWEEYEEPKKIETHGQ